MGTAVTSCPIPPPPLGIVPPCRHMLESPSDLPPQPPLPFCPQPPCFPKIRTWKPPTSVRPPPPPAHAFRSGVSQDQDEEANIEDEYKSLDDLYQEYSKELARTVGFAADRTRVFLSERQIELLPEAVEAFNKINAYREKLSIWEASYEDIEAKYIEDETQCDREEGIILSTANASNWTEVNNFGIPGYLSTPTPGTSESFVRGFGDTAAKHCFMKESFAVKKGFDIDRAVRRQVRLSQSHDVTTTGTVKVNFRFDGEADVYSVTFHVLSKCMQDVILGKSFLRLTKTYSNAKNFARRVKQRVLRKLSDLRLFYLGDSGPKFTGLLNGRPRQALADWGANALIMDEDFARKHGLPISDGPEFQNTVYLADKTKTRTSGMVHGVRWEFGLGGSGREHNLDFHILKNAPADVILGDDFLNQTSAFIEYDCYLVDEEDEDDETEAYFFGVKVVPDYILTASEQMAEDRRRDIADDRIARLPPFMRAEAEQQENERRAAWDALHLPPTTADNSSIQGSVSLAPSFPSQTSTTSTSPASSTTPTSSSSTSPLTASIQASAPTQPGVSPSSSAKRSKWRFKLKRRT